MLKCCIGHGIFTHSYLLKNEERLEFIRVIPTIHKNMCFMLTKR